MKNKDYCYWHKEELEELTKSRRRTLFLFAGIIILITVALLGLSAPAKAASPPADFQDWSQILPPEENIQNDRYSLTWYFDNPDAKKSKNMMTGWGLPKSLKPKFLIWVVIQRDDNNKTRSLQISHFACSPNKWEYLGEEIINFGGGNTPVEKRKIFSLESEFGKRLKKFFLEELKLTKEDFLKAIPAIYI